jgi:hypothetical protein
VDKKFNILFVKGKNLEFWNKLCTKFSIKKQLLVLTYPVKMKGTDRFEHHTVTFDDMIDDSLNLFYRMGQEMSKVVVSKAKKKARSSRPVEEKVDAMKKFVVVNRRYYEEMTPQFANKLIKLIEYVRMVMGVDAGINNLINMTTFVCHVKTCKKVKKISNTGHMKVITDHWKTHGEEGVHHDKSCGILIRRHNHLVSKLGASPWKLNDLGSAEELERVVDGAGSLAVAQMMTGAFLVKKSTKFAESSAMVDSDVVRGIANGDDTALALVPGNSMTNYFASTSS